ncbi:invasion regulator SirB1 [Providencia rettgeri]|uniref:invasion regulator SirB1 n=1 Tax=Providencia rettgeri TaxID=587 RepID=UPI003525FD80
MKTIANIEFNQLPLSEGIMTVSQCIRHDFPLMKVQAQLDSLVSSAKSRIDLTADNETKIQQLALLFYQEWSFGAAEGIYLLSDMLWLDKVLSSKQGTPVTLGAIFLYIAERLDIAIYPAIFPTQLLFVSERNDGSQWVINPVNGESLSLHTLNLWLKGTVDPFSEFYYDQLEAAENSIVIRKIFDTLKAALMEEKKMELALRVCETLLTLDPEDPYEIRDRGLILAHLDCNHVALSDLNYFIEHCPEDPVSEMIKIQIYSLDNHPVVLH